jgi:Mrp family chromosome partitioning ATPase
MFLSKEYSMKVLYVDTNLNHTAIPKIQNLPGVYSFVSEKKELAPLVVQTEYPGLYLLPSGAGKIAKNIGSNMLSREPIENLLQFCRTNFDMTIIDGQPLVSSPVMIEFARVVDMTLLVCRYGYSRHEVSKLAIDKLQKFGITSIGVILNDRKFPVPQKLYKLMG